MLVITVVLAVGVRYIANPVGFVVLFFTLYPIIMANSFLQIDSFAPATGAAPGPLRGTFLAIQATLYYGTEEERKPGIRRLRFLIGEGRAPRVQTDRAAVSRFAATMTSVVSVFPDPEHEANDRIPWSSLPATERPGVSFSFLLAVLEAWRIPDDMTTYQVCEKYVVPACAKANRGFLDVVSKTKCPGDWFGPMTVFVSHWWGYKTVELVRSVCDP